MNQKFPIGQFSCPMDIKSDDIQDWLDEMQTLPSHLVALVSNLEEHQLEKRYRENSWTIRQLVHHIFDSHLNGYLRMKLALTEDNPVVKTYEESELAKLSDYDLPIDVSLSLLVNLHERWTYLLKHLKPEQLQHTYQLPNGDTWRIEQSIGLYAWHGKHHLAHIKLALDS